MKRQLARKSEFAYSTGLIRTLETKLLNDNEVERMTLAKDAKDAFRILNELDYADNKAGISDPGDFQKVLDEGTYELKELLMKISPDNRILCIIWHQYDFHNIKTMVKAKVSGKSYAEIEEILSVNGAIPLEALRTVIFEEKDAEFGIHERTEKYLKKKIANVQKRFEKENRNPQVIDLYLDQKLMKIIYGIAIDSKSEFLMNYVKMLIDLSNIKLFFRMKTQNKPLDLYEIAFLYNGNIEFKKFKDAYP